MATKKATPVKKAVKKVATAVKKRVTSPVVKVTSKNMKSAEVKDMNLQDFVLGALSAAPEMNNEELFALVQKSGRANTLSTTSWFAARVRQGHITKRGQDPRA